MSRDKSRWFLDSILNSYSQVFFSKNTLFGIILATVSFVDFYAGLFGLLAVMIANVAAWLIGFDRFKIGEGYLGFNALLVGLGLGIYFEPGWLLVFLVALAGIMTLLVSTAMEGVIGKYALPYLSIPFVLSLWMFMLGSREFQALGLNERGIYTLNDIYIIGGPTLVRVYEWWNNLPLLTSLKAYLLSLGAIFFQYNVFSGALIAVGLLIYSRIAFTLSLLGFYIAFLFYLIIGVKFSEIAYSYIGFNYILTSIAVGGFFVIPHRNSYLALFAIIPITAVLTISISGAFAIWQLPIYSLPFNITVLLSLYALKFRVNNKANLSTIFVQHNSPEKNLYAFLNYRRRFGAPDSIPVHLPFYGEWTVTQGHNGQYTHKDDWRHAWDFEIKDEMGKTYRNSGDYPSDYYCYDKNIVSPADGVVEEVVDQLEDNVIGQRDLENNWGNTIVLKHSEYLYTKLCHLKPGSVTVKKGETVKRGQTIARCGNTGNSPYPHLHFQAQAFPFIGSKTLEYPLSEFLVRNGNGAELKTAGFPVMGEVVSNIQANAALKKAFKFTPGEKINFKITGGAFSESHWEVKRDIYLNRYIECRETRAKAWFRVSDSMMYFVHFEGPRRSPLYLFYLSAYKISFGYNRDLVIKDTFPVNKVFNPRKIMLQDFLAPFFRYLKGEYSIAYPDLKNDFLSDEIKLRGMIIKRMAGSEKEKMEFSFKVDNQGLREFAFRSKKINIQAVCVKA